jgi:hypothetical protein
MSAQWKLIVKGITNACAQSDPAKAEAALPSWLC